MAPAMRGTGKRMPGTGTVGGIAGVAIAVVGIVIALRLGLGSLEEPGPGMWPFVVSAGLLASAVLVIAVDRAPRDVPPSRRVETRKVLGGVGALAAYIAAFSWIGFLLPTLAVLLVWLRYLAGESWRSSVVLAVSCTAVLYVLFDVLLGVPFPQDILLPARG